MIDEVRRLLDYIVNQYAVRDEIRTIDMDASVIPDGHLIETDKQIAARREEQHADALAESFNTGMLMAWRRHRLGGKELQLDDRDEHLNSVADALIQFLVRFDLAGSRTEETEPMQYTYYLSVDWPRVFAVAAMAGVNLESALNRNLPEYSK